VSSTLPPKIIEQMRKAGLPTTGAIPYEPNLTTNRNGDPVIEKATIRIGPKQGKKGYVDTQGRIWIKDRAHAAVSDHWDVQLHGGADYIRVDLDGDLLP
jgi:hypothetical protein